MSNKRDLHTLFIKHDTDFGTLSKKALSDVILKVIFLQHGGTRLNQIKTELSYIIQGNVSEEMIDESLRNLVKGNKIIFKRGKYLINNNLEIELEKSAIENQALQKRLFSKYLSGGQTPIDILEAWFQDTLILFFENFSMEWFNHLTQNGKFSPKKLDNNISSGIDESLLLYGDKIKDEDHTWLKSNFIKFYESEEFDENMMFWNFGMSLFSSRLITARNYADKISIETYQNGTFLLDTNILMVLDLEGYDFGKSFASLDKIFNQLGIRAKFLHITSEEYSRAISARKEDTIHVFESFDEDVLKSTKCPFVQTALKRGCRNTEDIERMFQSLYNIPKSISELTKIEIIDYPELDAEIQKGCINDELKAKINEIHLRRLKREKRENPKIHDSGLIYGVNFLRKTDPTWVLTTDGTLKVYAIENIIRDETEIAIGLDALIGMFAVNNGGVDVDSSDFAPLFKSLIKHSLVPEDHIFDVRDLAFILSTNLRINDLDSVKVVNIANEVRRMRIAGKEDEEISLFLRREIEGQKLTIVNDLGRAKASEGMAIIAKAQAEKERDEAFEQIRNDRRSKLRDNYDTNLLINRCLLVGIPILVSVIVFLTLRFGMDALPKIQYIVACSIEFIFGVIPFIPIHKKLIKKHSEYVQGINEKVENEILELKRKVKN